MSFKRCFTVKLLLSIISYYCISLQQDYQICDSGPTVEAGCDGGGTTARDISDDLELARQLDFDSESLPFNDQQGETDSSQLHGNGAGEIQISTESNRGYSGDNTSKELSGSSRTSCPTPTAGHKVRSNPL